MLTTIFLGSTPSTPASWVLPDSVVIRLELNGIGNGWTDVTGDLTDEDLARLRHHSNRPEDRCADTGRLLLRLRNGFNNSGGRSATTRPTRHVEATGFGFGIRTQLAITYSGA
jgi:hypothetical protein